LQNERLQQIGLKVASLPLQNGGDALQSHACVNRRPRQGSQIPTGISIELHEDEVPDFDITATFARKLTICVPLLAGRCALVIVEFGTRSAWARLAHRPEIVLLTQSEDAVAGNVDRLVPDLERLFVIPVNRHP
jgi:hypothetical protein